MQYKKVPPLTISFKIKVKIKIAEYLGNNENEIRMSGIRLKQFSDDRYT